MRQGSMKRQDLGEDVAKGEGAKQITDVVTAFLEHSKI